MNRVLIKSWYILAIGVALLSGPIVYFATALPPQRTEFVIVFVELGGIVALVFQYVFAKRISRFRISRVITVSVVACLFCLILMNSLHRHCVYYVSNKHVRANDEWGGAVYFPMYVTGTPSEKLAVFGSRQEYVDDVWPATVRSHLNSMPGGTIAYLITDGAFGLLGFGTSAFLVFAVGFPGVFLGTVGREIHGFAVQVGYPQGGDFERIFNERIGLIPARGFIGRFTQRTRCVCRFELPKNQPVGTAFLVAPDVIMTNHHVIQMLRNGDQTPDQVVLRFDYDQIVELPGNSQEKNEYHLAEDWLAAYSEENQFDYALLRLSEKAGDEKVRVGDIVSPRGWIHLKSIRPSNGESVFILQHPEGDPLQVAIGSIIESGTDDKYIRYTTNTERGSSGSPCLDQNLDFVALHHWGSEIQKHNRGIRIDVILADLSDKNKADLVQSS